jgi:hypothetical protein
MDEKFHQKFKCAWGTRGKKMHKYAAWKVDECRAVSGELSIPIVRDKHKQVYALGEYGVFSSERTVAISGVCLFDARWSVEFSSGGVRSIALPLDRLRVQERIQERNFEVSRVIFPLTLTSYHTKLLRFVSDVVAESKPDKLLFHIPKIEYQIYIQNLEKLIGKEIPKAQSILDEFVEKVESLFLAEMKRIDFEHFELIRPMCCGASSTEEAYSLPYQHPEVFGASKEMIYAIEDLVELKIALLTEQNLGYTVPVKFCVLDIPHPYVAFSKKNAAMGMEVVAVEL